MIVSGSEAAAIIGNHCQCWLSLPAFHNLWSVGQGQLWPVTVIAVKDVAGNLTDHCFERALATSKATVTGQDEFC
jgi:hypothetical protein